MSHTPQELIETYLSQAIANLGYPVGMGLPLSPEHAKKMAENCVKLAAGDLVAALKRAEADLVEICDGKGCSRHRSERLAELRAALARARGV